MTRLRIAVTGLAATFPYGGVFWDYLQYPLGFARLGHDVLYVEDTGKWCYDPAAATFVEARSANAPRLARHLAALDERIGWFFRDATGATYGRSWEHVVRFCRSADLFLHVSASCWMRDEYHAARRVAFLDSDPMYTQASVPGYLAGDLDAAARDRVEQLARHDVHLTFAERVGAPDCLVPTGLFDWRPTRQPVVLDQFTPLPVSARRRVATTVGSWEPHEDGPVIGGVAYRGKSAEFARFADLPARTTVPLELALSGDVPAERLLAAGWRLADATAVSANPWRYRDYLATSLCEWSVAKHAYVASRSGWFSCRTACYLALGVPAVVQDTGFRLPRGEGLLAFSTPEEAAEGLAAVAAAPERHAKAARDLAEAHLDARVVLTDLLEVALA